MKFKLELTADNDAFDVNLPGLEVARILRETADRLDQQPGLVTGMLRDLNGNHVGKWELTRARRRDR